MISVEVLILFGLMVVISIVIIFLREVEKFREIIKDVCPHKIIEKEEYFDSYECIICKRFFVKSMLPKGSKIKTICYKKVK